MNILNDMKIQSSKSQEILWQTNQFLWQITSMGKQEKRNDYRLRVT